MPNKKQVRFDWAMKNILRKKANLYLLDAFFSNLLKEEIKVLDILESESNMEQKIGNSIVWI